ncbi:acyl carrier protein [Sabulilitoribacter multivorans]|uniref:Acyl carrier protein n=1 Tax=Flaviramulus multivorans TaxID=1304750 RepID=A0ABS9IJK5_9FLAO|nr:acyl carrier protein [Flaviramulus multivorans]MCF7560781.1 acyl carrier protein [Flaviramulus multivorans]
MNQYLDILNELFREVLDNESIDLKPETTANDIDEWDSINHIYLVVEIEKKFNIKFKSSQILEWKNVGEIIESIQDKK